MPQLPYIYFNTIQKGELTPPSTDAENVLIFGNTPQSLPATIDMPKIAKYWAKTKNKISIYQRIWDYFSSRPMSYLELSFRKFLLFWDSREIPNNVNLKRNLRESQIFEYIAFIPNYILLSLGISGILYFISFLRKDRKLFILFYIVIAYWVSISCFYIVGRFRAPVFPILAVFTGGFLSRALLPPTRRNILLLLLLIISGLAITLKSYDYYRLYFQQYVMKYVRPAGTYVSMGEKKMVLDNGSFFPDSYSWKNFSPYPGMSITKYFYIKKNHFPQSYTFKLIVGFNNPGFVELEVNNKNYLLKSSEEKQKGKLVCKFNSVDIKKHKNEKLLIVKINIKRVSEGVYFYLDRRRDYNRTKINNKIIDSELVSRIIF